MSVVLRIKELKGGQLKIQQMVFLLLAITLFFILVLLFYLGIKISGLKDAREDLEKQRLEGLVEKIASTPEFSFEGTPRAVDKEKLIILDGESDYKDFWKVKGIIVRKLPLTESVIECNSGNYDDCNTIKVFTDSNTAPTGSYVSLCSKKTKAGRAYDYCEMAVLMLEMGVENEE